MRTLKKIFYILLLIIILTGCTESKREYEDDIPPILNKVNVWENVECSEIVETPKIKELQEEKGNYDLEEIVLDEESESGLILDGAESSITLESTAYTFNLLEVPPYSGAPYIVLNDNQPTFPKDDVSTQVFEEYSEFDELGRCGVAYANICKEMMPIEERGAIGFIKPSGWHTVKYNDLIDGNYLYNRCHLIGYQLAGENANEKNLITGTRYLNVQGMLPFENMVAGYVEETNNHVLYRVTPIFEDENLIASGVIIEALSVEDKGIGICFNVYVYNVQPGIVIDYKTGDSERDLVYTGTGTKIKDEDNEKDNDDAISDNQSIVQASATGMYILNTNTHKFHYSSCSSVYDMAEKNKKESNDTRKEIIVEGYEPCKRCNP